MATQDAIIERMQTRISTSETNGIYIDGIFSPCYEWQGSLDRGGYGKVSIDGRTVQTHRAFYALCVGDVSRKLVLDHLCSNRRCLRPEHLEPVSQRVNVMRGKSPIGEKMRAKGAT